MVPQVICVFLVFVLCRERAREQWPGRSLRQGQVMASVCSESCEPLIFSEWSCGHGGQPLLAGFLTKTAQVPRSPYAKPSGTQSKSPALSRRASVPSPWATSTFCLSALSATQGLILLTVAPHGIQCHLPASSRHLLQRVLSSGNRSTGEEELFPIARRPPVLTTMGQDLHC